MRKLNSGNIELIRLKSVLSRDRTNITTDFSSLIKYDLEKLLKEYLELKASPEIEIKATTTGYELILKASASRLKPMGSLPE